MLMLMLYFAEFWMAVYGVYVLWTGKMYLGQTVSVRGTAARLLAGLLLLPLPLSLFVGVYLILIVRIPLHSEWAGAIEWGIFVACMFALWLIGGMVAESDEHRQHQGSSLLHEPRDGTAPETAIRAAPPMIAPPDDRFRGKNNLDR